MDKGVTRTDRLKDKKTDDYRKDEIDSANQKSIKSTR